MSQSADDFLRHKTRRSFIAGGIATVAAGAAYYGLAHAHETGTLQWPLRKAENMNAAILRTLRGERGRTREYDPSLAEVLRVNGDIGMSTGLKLDSWRLQLAGLDRPESYRQFSKDLDLWEYKSDDDAPPEETAAPQPQLDTKAEAPKAGQRPHIDMEIPINTGASNPPADMSAVPGVQLTLSELQAFPQHEMVTQFKCIEGWSQIVRWRGVRFSDVFHAFPPQKNAAGLLPAYVNMETPDGTYTASFNLASLLNPQTLLSTHMHGEPLTEENGAPLRLTMPLKYGYKQIKQIARITYTHTRPADYWEALGYDWYAGL